MRHGIAAMLLAAQATAGGLVHIAAWRAEDGCTCIKLMCCCGPKKAAPGLPCHGTLVDGHDAAFKCRHDAVRFHVPALFGLIPPVAALWPVAEESFGPRSGGESPREGIRRVEPHPPRSSAFAS